MLEILVPEPLKIDEVYSEVEHHRAEKYDMKLILGESVYLSGAKIISRVKTAEK